MPGTGFACRRYALHLDLHQVENCCALGRQLPQHLLIVLYGT